MKRFLHGVFLGLLAWSSFAADVTLREGHPNQYVVKKGDTLGDISKKTLGTSKRWQEFVELNKIIDEDRIPAGTVLKIPAMRG